MVYQKDYILRMIEMLGDFIAAVMGYLQKKQVPEAQQILDRAWTDLLRQEAAFFSRIPDDRLTDALMQEHNYTSGHLEIVAGLFWLEAEVRKAGSDPESSLPFYKKALILYDFTDRASGTFSLERQARISEIRAILSN